MYTSTSGNNNDGWAIYLRGSTDPFDANEQCLRIEQEAITSPPFFIVREYRERGAAVGLEWECLLADARAGAFSHLAVWSPDRLSRDPLQVEAMLFELYRWGITVVFARPKGSEYSLV